MTRRRISWCLAIGLVVVASIGSPAAEGFDHAYGLYGRLLADHVTDGRVDYEALARDSASLELVVRAFGSVTADELDGWSREEQLAFWMNAYNAFTLKSIVDHYPIQGSWFSLHPRNSIRQIDGVWDERTWDAAGRAVTLDDLEHVILRPTFGEPRIHFAINCASISCPPLRPEPYRADDLDSQLQDSSRLFLGSAQGVEVDGTTLRVTSILDWYGDDFIEGYTDVAPAGGTDKERAILGAVIRHGPSAAATLAKSGNASLRFLAYDWSLNDIER